MAVIVDSLEPITLVGGGFVDRGDLISCLSFAPKVIAADSGAQVCQDLGAPPDAVIGDMDSVSEDVLSKLPPDRIHQIKEQNSTDFDKALRSISAPLVLGVGFCGGRLDHELACFSTLLQRPDRRCILLGPEDILFLAPPELSLPLDSGTRVSLFPLAPVQGRSQGLEWPVDDLFFEPGGQLGTSNLSTGPVRMTWEQPGMLVILPKACLGIAVTALAAQPGSWPAL